MKVLVLGANGFLGRYLVKRCLREKWEVDCVYNKNRGNIPRECKLFNINELQKVSKSYDVVFLLAAHIPYQNFELPDKRFIETNIKAPLSLIEKFRKSKIVFSSSISVYGAHKSKISETSSFRNPTLYGLGKLSTEFILSFHPDYQIIRFSSLYGKGMSQNTFIPKILKQARKEKTIILWGKGFRRQDYLYVEDAVDYLLATVSRKESGIYLGVHGKSYTNTQVAKIVQKFSSQCKIKYTGKDNSPFFVYNNLVTRKLLNFTPKVSFYEGSKKLMKNE